MDVFKTLILDTPDSLGNISGVLDVANGGTGADNASDARVNLLPDYTGNANKVLSLNGTATDVEWTSNGAGDVAGPASSTDNAVVRFDSTTGKVIQNSGVTISDANLLTADALSINNNTTLGSSNTDTVTFNARAASEFTPATDNTYDLGRTGHEWRDLYLDGTANIDSLIADTADINGGTIDGTAIGATTPSTGAFTTISGTTGTFTGTIGARSGNVLALWDSTNADYSYIQNNGSSAATQTLIYNSYGSGSVAHQFKTYSGAVVEAMSITPAGNVGVGTSSPAERLSVAGGNLNLEDNYSLNWSAAPGRPYIVGSKASDFIKLGTPSGGDLLNLVSTNVGIGTSSPSTKLHVATAINGGIAVNDGTVNGIIYGSGWATNSFAIGTTTNHPLVLVTNNAGPQMTLATSGNVGIGTESPSTFRTKVLEVADGTNAGIVVNGDATNAYASLRLTNSGTSGWDLNYNFPNAGDLGFFDIGADDTRMTITSTGNIGVGTSAPTARLVVSGGGAAIQGNGFPTTGAGWEFYTDTTTGSWAQSYSRTGSAWLDANWNALTHKYSTSGAERMRITSGGDVIIGGTAIPNGTTDANAWDNVQKYVHSSRNDTALAYHFVFRNPNGEVGSITTSGSATAYNTSSDYRLKENVVPLQDALQRITQLKPSRFNFIADDSVVVDGFIAHEVQEVVPEAISGEKDAMREEEYEVTPAVLDDDGNEITPPVMDTRSVPEYQGIDQSKLVPLLVGAVQELTARLEALENN